MLKKKRYELSVSFLASGFASKGAENKAVMTIRRGPLTCISPNAEFFHGKVILFHHFESLSLCMECINNKYKAQRILSKISSR